MTLGDLTISVVAVFGGIQVVLTGLTAFLAKIWIARIHDREVASLNERLEHLKNRLQTISYTQKVHFDTEFKIHSELWPKVRALKAAIFEISFDQKADSKSIDERRDTLRYALKELHDAVEDRRPFFAARIAAELFELLDLAEKEAERDAGDRALRPAQDRGIIHATGARNLYDLTGRCNQVYELIRERLTGGAVSEPADSTTMIQGV